ncbi:MAG: ABC transporter substrate-binding protein [Chloroflexi bacterium]|nr:ABC transporter substrate-binding protein [Chloroflexota bacterium]
MSKHQHLDRPDDGVLSRGMSRRTLLRALVTGAGATALSGVLAACGQQAAPAPAKPAETKPAESKPAEAAKPAAPAAPAAPAPTTAPAPAAAAKPAEAAKPAAAGGASGGQISVHWTKPVTFNTLYSTAGSEQGVERLMFGALVRINDKLEAVPDLAEKIDVSPDAKTYTFTLKKGITFSDGKPLTAQDVKFTLERAIDKRAATYWRGRLVDIEGATEYGDTKMDGVSGVQAPDDSTIKITLRKADSTFLLTLGDFSGLSILPAHVLKDVAPDQLQKHPFSLNPNVSAGAFQFVKYETDQYLEIKRNDNYTGGPKAKLDRIFFKLLAADAAIAQMERGELDLMIVPTSEMERLKKVSNVTVVSVPSPSIDFLAINVRKDYLKDKRVRQAMLYALDREAVVKAIYQGEAQVVNQTIIGPDWMGNLELNPYKFDPGKAKELLKAASWDSGRSLQAVYVPGTKERDAYMPIIQQQFKEVGITMEIIPAEATEYTRRRNAGEFDIGQIGGGIFRQDPNVSGKYMETSNFVPVGGNYGHYTNTRLDELFPAGRATTDQAQRKKIYTEAAQILNDDVPWIYLWSPNSIFAHSKKLVGFKPPSYATHNMWNADEWTVAG